MDNSYLDDSDRLAALAETELLDSPSEEAFDRVARLAQRLLSAPVALVSLVDRDRQYFKSAEGLSGEAGEARETPLSHSFCQYVVINGSELVVEDARRNPLLKDNLAIRDLGVIAYVGVPILAPDGERLGSFCAIDTTPRHWTDQELQLIRDLGRIVNDQIDQRQCSRKLLKSSQDLKWALARLSSFKIAVDHHSLVSVTNRAGIIKVANSKFCEVSGYTADELVGKNHRILNSYAHNRVFFEEMWATIGSGKVWQGEIRNRAKDGTFYWVATTIVPAIGADGRPEEYISIRTEITSHRRLVELLSESQNLAEVGGWELIIPTGKLDWTIETYRIFNLSESEGINLETQLKIVSEEYRDRLRKAIDQAINTGESFDMELQINRHDMAASWIRMTGRVDVTDYGAYRVVGYIQNIDSSKQAQLSLITSEERFRSFASTVPVGMWESDAEGNCLYTNLAWQETAELSPEESLGVGFAAAIHPEDRARVLHGNHRSPRAGEVLEQDFRFMTRSGKIKWVNSRCTPLMRDGRVVGYVGANQDVTQYRHTLDLLNRTQELAAVGGWEYFIHDKRLVWTKETYRIHELEARDSIQIQEADDFYHPDSRELIDGLLQRCITTGSPWDAELRIITAKGNLRWVRAIGRADVEQGRAVRLSGTFQDITERKNSHDALAASETRFRTLANVLPVGIYETDANGNCTYANDSWCEITGLSVAESLDSGWGGAIHSEDRDAVYSEWSKAVKEIRDFDFDFRFQHPDGSIRWVHSVATSIIREGELLGFVGVNEDITERRRSVDAMAASLAEKETLLREVHHRVKNNLQLVSSLLNLQMGYVKDETALNLFRESQGRVRSMAMIHEMLYSHTELARINAADYLKTLATAVLRIMTASPNRVNLVDKLTPVALNPDRAIPLGLILNELLTNSVKYGASGENLINVNLELTQSERGNIQLDYSDDGPGLPPDFNPKETKSLGFRLIGLLSKQLRAELTPPQGGERLHYRIEFQADDPTETNPS